MLGRNDDKFVGLMLNQAVTVHAISLTAANFARKRLRQVCADLSKIRFGSRLNKSVLISVNS
jgi:hypothetical protein